MDGKAGILAVFLRDVLLLAMFILTGTTNRGASIMVSLREPGLGNLTQVWEQNRDKGVRV